MLRDGDVLPRDLEGVVSGPWMTLPASEMGRTCRAEGKDFRSQQVLWKESKVGGGTKKCSPDTVGTAR